jgi:hypothetical protein
MAQAIGRQRLGGSQFKANQSKKKFMRRTQQPPRPTTTKSTNKVGVVVLTCHSSYVET